MTTNTNTTTSSTGTNKTKSSSSTAATSSNTVSNNSIQTFIKKNQTLFQIGLCSVLTIGTIGCLIAMRSKKN